MIDFLKSILSAKSEEKNEEIINNSKNNDKEKEAKIVRKKAIFTGRVQGVGFRFEAYSTAANMGLTGYVINQEDSSVLLEVQGDLDQVLAFIDHLKKLDRASVDRVEIQDLPVKDFETAFKITC
ncbi:MAG: acylphosphatase [Tissierellia bacterium]|nr:acylphosphatase [Tissierellia bacterium]